MNTKPLVLCILDGVGVSADKKRNAVARARMPFFRRLLREYPNAAIRAAGAAAGLPPGTMGNSEVGHIAIGAGRVVNQFLRRFQLEDWDASKPLSKFIADMKRRGGEAHLMGLMSTGRVHSDMDEIILIAKRLLGAGLRVCVHFFADGRDVLPKSALKYIGKLRRGLPRDNSWRFGTLTGRYYAMDRNNNAERTRAAFEAIANGRAEFRAETIEAALRAAYARGESDEFIKPTIICPKCRPITPKDGILFCNYRSDRARQILRMLIPTGARMLAFAQYGEGLDEAVPALLPNIPVKNTFGDVIAAAGLSQLRIAETEKYNHVTYFFDAERTMNYPREEKVLIPSPPVATFDLKPEMSAKEITDALLPRLRKFDAVILNYANGDMVGHTGVQAAAIRAMEALDAQLARLVPAVLKLGGTVLITADHGNAEKMWDEKTNAPWTAHTANRVPFIVVSPRALRLAPRAKAAGLADIAPTMLRILNIPQPKEMTGKPIILSVGH
jgi:2,3-bisphosphoglycerate-independent phosphoglycerate mutase